MVAFLDLFMAFAALGIAFFAGVSEAQLFLEARYVHVTQSFRAAVERHRAEFKQDVTRSLPVVRVFRRRLEFTLNGLGGAAPTLFSGGLLRRRKEGLYYFEDWPRSLYGDFFWPRTIPLWASYWAVRTWARAAAARPPGDDGREERHAGKAGEHAARMLWNMWLWRRAMTLKWFGILLTSSSAGLAIAWSLGWRP